MPRRLLILGLFTELLGPGGVQRIGRHTAAVLTSLAFDQGQSCRILSLNDPPGHHVLEVGGYQLAFQGFGRRKVAFVAAALRAACEAQLAHLGHPNLASLGLIMRIANPKLRYWITAHGIEVWSPLPLERRLGLRIASGVICPSRFTADQVVKIQGVQAAKVTILPWAVDPEIWKLDSAILSYLPSGRILLTVARLSKFDRYKGVDMVIEALPKILSIIPNTYYIIIGDGDDRPRLERLVTDLGLQDHVIFVGKVTESELVAYYRACDVFIMPSAKEGFGLVFLEAMAFGKPVIGGNHGGTPDIVVDGKTGFLVEYGDVDALADRLIRLLQDEKLRRCMGEAARRHVKENFSFKAFRERLVELLAGNNYE